MKKLAFYLVALPITSGHNGYLGSTEFTDPINGYDYEILDVLENRDEDGNMKVRVLCLNTQEDFVTTYDRNYLVEVY